MIKMWIGKGEKRTFACACVCRVGLSRSLLLCFYFTTLLSLPFFSRFSFFFLFFFLCSLVISRPPPPPKQRVNCVC